ncbi:MAG: TonB-dependent receptor domain-containing protein [Gemmatimonadota bacterium]
MSIKRRVRAASVAAVFLLISLPGGALAQAPEKLAGRIVGRVIDGETGRPVASAQVFLADGSIGGLTSVNGQYVLRGVPAGTRDIIVQVIGYATKTVTGVDVPVGRAAVLDVTLEPEAVALEGITVSASVERGSTSALLTERRMAAVVQDAIGSDQIARTPDSDAGAALKRVPGISVVDGKYAYVRGLGERYSSTTLNGSPLASPVPDKKAIPLDVIPAGLLQSIVTSKSYSPEQPGDYAGGLVQLRTKSFPANRLVGFSLSGSWNSAASFKEGIGYNGGARDFLGFDDGTRRLPSLIRRDVPVNRRTFSSEQLQEIGRSFAGDWAPTPRKLPPNAGLSLSFGDDFDLGGSQRLGFVASANYSSKFSTKRNLVERVFAQSGGDDPEVDYSGQVSERSVSVGGLVNVTYQPRSAHQVTLGTVYNHLTADISRVLQGFNLDSNTNQWNSRIQYLGQSLFNSQLRGEHVLGFLGDANFEWRGAYTRARRYEPNTREVLYREFDGTFYWDDFIQSGSVFHQDMVDSGWNGGASLRLPFRANRLPGTLSIGASTDRKDRDAYTRRFRFRPVPGGEITNDVRTEAPNELFSIEHIQPDGFEIQEATFRTDNYDAGQDIDAAYAVIEFEPVARFKVSGGARVERTLQVVNPKDLWETSLDALEGARLETTDILPALNLTLALNPSMNLRVSASRTLARPQLRELAPFSFADYAGGYLVLGNPQLDRARIGNLDLRWEWFTRSGGVLAVSGFYKRFEHPIETTILPSTELIKTWVNAEAADNYGAEVEVQSHLGFLSEALSPLRFNGNLTLVRSQVTTGDVAKVFIPGLGKTELEVVSRSRALQGQSPYVVNLGLTWTGSEGRAATVLFNRFGRRIDAVGGQATPEVFEEARSQLDVVVEWPLGKGWRAKVAGNRLLGNQVEFTQGGGTLRSYDMGRSISLSMSWGSGR